MGSGGCKAWVTWAPYVDLTDVLARHCRGGELERRLPAVRRRAAVLLALAPANMIRAPAGLVVAGLAAPDGPAARKLRRVGLHGVGRLQGVGHLGSAMYCVA
jgi:hypothetical protein